MFEFRLKFHWSLIPASNWQFSNIGSVNGLATGVIAIVWTNDGYQVYRRIYASLGLIGLTRLYWDRLSHFSPYAFIVFWIVLVYCMPQFYMGSNKDFFELNWIEYIYHPGFHSKIKYHLHLQNIEHLTTKITTILRQQLIEILNRSNNQHCLS